MKEYNVSNVTDEKFEQLKKERWGGDLENDTALFLLCDDLLDE